jgi:non-specific serine/threonine protein kinase/serine/threonine-protein kinase
LDAPTYQRIKSLYLEARELGWEERGRFLDERCAGESELRAEVEGLLGQEETLGGFLARPATETPAPRAEAEELSHPERIGAYRIRRPLGFGGMGVVYLAEQDSPKRAVALKLLRFDSASPRQIERFEREAELLGRLAHPGIARVYEAGWAETETGRRPFYAMEYVEGQALHEFVSAHGLDLGAKLKLVSQVAEAAHYAHERGVVHRDLKPSNVLVDERGEPRVLDFGVARSLGTDSNATQTGQLVGTLSYMSPEQASGRNQVDSRSDVYSLGVILYELLTGRLPVQTEGLALHEAVRRVREEEPIAAGSVRKELKGDLETVLDRALAKEPERRYASAAEFAEDLRLFLDHRPIRARRPTAPYVAWKLVRRHRMLAGTVVALFLALSAAQYFTLRYVQQGRELANSEAQKRFYFELGQKLAELDRIKDLQEQGDRFQGAEQPLEVLEEWAARAERATILLDLRRAELQSMLGYRGESPVTPGESQLLLNTQTEIVNHLDRMIGSRGHLPEIRARILSQRARSARAQGTEVERE